MASKDCCFIGRGKVWIQKTKEDGCPTVADPNPNPRIFVGNTESLNVSITENTVEKKSFTTSAGGVECSFTEIETIDLSLETSCFNTENLALALFGTQSTVAAAAVTDEVQRVNAECELIPFSQLPDSDVAVTVTSSPAGTTYVEGTDYARTPGGIEILEGTSITLGADILVSYSSKEQDRVELITNSTDTYTIILDGVNGSSGKPIFTEWYKVRFNPISSLDLISEDFATIGLSGKVLADACKTGGTGISQFGKLVRCP